MSDRQSPTTAPSIGELHPGQSIDLPLPPIALGRRVAYQRIQRDAHTLFGAGNYQMRAAGCRVTITRMETRHGAA